MKTLLIVEDEKLIRQGISTMIQRSGIPVEEILECNNGQDALEILKSQKVDVMFTDIRMPKMDGMELVKRMQECVNIPITVAISGYDEFSYAVEMMRYGVKEYLLKPVDRDKVKEVLQTCNKEVIQKQQNDAQIRSISCQQMKYFILQENETNDEWIAMVKQLQKLFYPGRYLVFCRAMRKENAYNVSCPVICLDDLESQQILIIEEKDKEQFLQSGLGGSFVGQSKTHQGLLELKQAYWESLEARKQSFAMGRSIVAFEDIENKGVNVNTDNLSALKTQIQQIILMIATEKVEEACSMLGNIAFRVKRKELSVDDYAEGILELTDGIWATYQNVLEVDNQILEQYKHLLVWPSLDLFEEDLLKWVRDFHNRLHLKFLDYKNRHKIQQAVEYIRQNYETDLNMAVVSNLMNMNYSLFSYEFKQYTGSNFVTFLRDLRISEAKRLLIETNLRIAEIGRKTGYENEKHFMKIFRSVCGVSPTEYRKLNCGMEILNNKI